MVLATAHPASHSNDVARRRQSREDPPVTTQRRRPNRGPGPRGPRARTLGPPLCLGLGLTAGSPGRVDWSFCVPTDGRRTDGRPHLRGGRSSRQAAHQAPERVRPAHRCFYQGRFWCNSQGLNAAGWAPGALRGLGNAQCLEGQVSVTVCGPLSAHRMSRDSIQVLWLACKVAAVCSWTRHLAPCDSTGRGIRRTLSRGEMEPVFSVLR